MYCSFVKFSTIPKTYITLYMYNRQTDIFQMAMIFYSSIFYQNCQPPKSPIYFFKWIHIILCKIIVGTSTVLPEYILQFKGDICRLISDHQKWCKISVYITQWCKLCIYTRCTFNRIVHISSWQCSSISHILV